MGEGVGEGEWEAPRRRRRWPLVALVALAAVAGWLVRSGPSADLSVEHVTASPEPQPAAPPSAVWSAGGPPAEPGALVAGRWELLAPAPLDGRTDASLTWTGTEAVAWGGLADAPRSDGARYDPATDTWSPMPDGPLSARFAHAAVWNGAEVVVLGGASAPPAAGDAPLLNLDDAAGFDPATLRWRRLPRLPFPTGAGHVLASGNTLFALAADVRPDWLARLRPGDRRWTVLDVPRPGGIRPQGAGTLEVGIADRELVVWNRRDAGAGVAVDIPVTGQWRPIRRAPRPLPPVADCCLLVASAASVDGVDVIAYDPAEGVWRPAGESTPGSLAAGGDLIFLVRLHSTSGALHARAGTPLRLPPAPLSPRYGAATAWAGDRLLTWGGAEFQGDRRNDGAAFRPLR